MLVHTDDLGRAQSKAKVQGSRRLHGEPVNQCYVAVQSCARKTASLILHDNVQVELLTEALQSAGKNVEFCVTVPRHGGKSRQMLENLHHKYIKWLVRTCQATTHGLVVCGCGCGWLQCLPGINNQS